MHVSGITNTHFYNPHPHPFPYALHLATPKLYLLNTRLYNYFYISIYWKSSRQYEFTPMCLTPVQHHRFCPNLLPFHIYNSVLRRWGFPLPAWALTPHSRLYPAWTVFLPFSVSESYVSPPTFCVGTHSGSPWLPAPFHCGHLPSCL